MNKNMGNPSYRIWAGIKQRCLNPKQPTYKNYGGRGITICDRWKTSYDAFATDMGPRPSPKHSIDRIDVNGNYEPGNCRWATSAEQAKNKQIPWRGTTRANRSFLTVPVLPEEKLLIKRRAQEGGTTVAALIRGVFGLTALALALVGCGGDPLLYGGAKTTVAGFIRTAFGLSVLAIALAGCGAETMPPPTETTSSLVVCDAPPEGWGWGATECNGTDGKSTCWACHSYDPATQVAYPVRGCAMPASKPGIVCVGDCSECP